VRELVAEATKRSQAVGDQETNPVEQFITLLEQMGEIIEALERGEEVGQADRKALEEFSEYIHGLGEAERKTLHEIGDLIMKNLDDRERYFALVKAWNACPEESRKVFVEKIVSCSPIELGSKSRAGSAEGGDSE
jgi:hypothetical protein